MDEVLREEGLVYGSDHRTILDWFREQRDTAGKMAQSEYGELHDRSLAEYVRTTHFNLSTRLSMARWPNNLVTRTFLERKNETDWQLFPYFGKYSPWFPGFEQARVIHLEFEGEDEIQPNAVLKWCNDNAARLQEMAAREVMEPVMHRLGVLL